MQVLDHYNKPEDSLKLQAAKFLIKNMVVHYSFVDTLYTQKFYNELDSVFKLTNDQKGEIRDSLYRGTVNKYPEKEEYICDLEFISAEYLIDNIDKAFIVWDVDWARHVDFDSFCEYLLAYKVFDLQDIDDWRDYFLDFSNGDLKNHKYCELYRFSPYKACETVNHSLRDNITHRLQNEYNLPVKKMSTLTKIPFGLCDDYNVLAVSVMRAKGIPCTIDYTPQWPFRSLGHSWCVLLENSGKHIVFEGANGTPASPHNEDHKMAKVFRTVFSPNSEIIDIHEIEEYIPEFLRSPCIKDVSAEYFKTVDLHLTIPNRSNHRYAYLSVFDNQNWVPIHWGKIRKSKAIFKDMGKDIVYLPTFYDINGIKPFSDPIILTIKGEEIHLKADTLSKKSLTLLRKYPPMEGIFKVSHRVVGGKFQASNDSLFTDSLTVTVHEIIDRGITAQEVLLDSISSAYRYWRYRSPDGAHCNIAELFFYDKDSLITIPTDNIIGTEGTYRKDEGDKYARGAVFDRDALTFFDAPHINDCWVGVDFKEPINLSKIRYLPRSDGNCIEIGDEYELFYWGNDQWKSLGKIVADNIILTFDNCPSNALFLLHNHTKGKEERIFTYEDGEQLWW